VSARDWAVAALLCLAALPVALVAGLSGNRPGLDRELSRGDDPSPPRR
jgi:hypothetical protein